MRVLYFIQEFGNTPFITSQITQISEQNNVKVLCLKNSYTGNNLDIVEVPIKEPKILWKLRNRLELSDIVFNYFNPFWAGRIENEVRRFSPDVLHIQFGYDAVIFLQNFFPKKLPIVVTFRGYDASLKLILRTYRRELKRILAQPNVYPVFVSNSLRSNLLSAGLEINALHEVIYSNTNTAFFKRKSYDHSREILRFTQVSNFREKKGHRHTIRAFERVTEKFPFRLTFVGKKDGDFEKLIRDISDSPILDRIEFIDALDKEGIRDVLEHSHYFVHNSITSRFNDQEGIPNAVMEAMSMELPILTTQHAGLKELNNGEVDVYYSEEGNIEEYVRNIVIATGTIYSTKNRERIINSFSSERFQIQLLDFYNRIILN